MSTAQTDYELAQAIAHGTVSCVADLYERHSSMVYSLCLRMTGNPWEAEDLTHDIFIQLLSKVGSFRGEGQFTTGGKLPSAAVVGSPGLLAVKIRLDDKAAADGLEMGAPGTVAIYTDWGKPFHVISKVTVRMQKWLYFLPIPGK